MRHGILMTAHNNVEVVKTALRMLDDDRFTLYLLVDKKSPLEPEAFLPELQNMRTVVLERIKINWGGYSQIQAMLNLVRAAVNDGVDYVHFLQNADLPLKTPDEIDRFFTVGGDKNYIWYTPWQQKVAPYRFFCKHFFVDFPSYRHNKILKALNHGLAKPQKLLVNMDRPVSIGSSLMSLSGAFCRYLVDMEPQIRKEYRFSLAGDEIFVPNIIEKSPFADTVAYKETGTRLIDWVRREGHSPHTFDMGDIEMLQQAMDCEYMMFARKFDQSRDMRVVLQVERLVAQRGSECDLR